MHLILRMNSLISSKVAADIFRRTVDGQSVESIANDLGLPINIVSQMLSNVQSSMLPKPSKRKSPTHKLTQADRRKGGSASQRTKRAQREQFHQQLCSLVDLSNRSLHTAAIAYFLLSGSPKEYSVTIPNEEVGLIFLKALKKIDAPHEAIHFQWRTTPDSQEEEGLVRSDWGKLGEIIEFAAIGHIKSLRLRVSGFSRVDRGELKVSSRGLAQAFLSKGREAINEAAK